MSREPLGPLTRHGDNNWNDIVSWTVLCTFNAEFLGIDQSNVDSFLGGDDPVVTDLLGETGDLGQNLGLNNDFCYQIIKQVGSYADIYNRNLGPDTPFNLPRGLNALYNDGGILTRRRSNKRSYPVSKWRRTGGSPPFPHAGDGCRCPHVANLSASHPAAPRHPRMLQPGWSTSRRGSPCPSASLCLTTT